MIWNDEGFLLAKNKYNENSLIVEIFTRDHGKVSGIIFGGTSKKIKNYLQIGNNLHVNYNAKSENRIGYFKIEILEATSPYYFDDPGKLLCISSAMNLVKILTAELQKNYIIFKLIKKFYIFLAEDNWIKNYIFWELELFKALGYDLEFESLVQKEIINGNIQYFTKSINEKKIIPTFLIDKNSNIEDKKILIKAFRIVGDYLDKTILKPNNLNQPISRILFSNVLK